MIRWETALWIGMRERIRSGFLCGSFDFKVLAGAKKVCSASAFASCFERIFNVVEAALVPCIQ